jgi:hypothetical protein
VKGYKTITAAALALVGAAVALILHYSEAAVLDPGALSAAWTSLVTALVFGALRFATDTPAMSSGKPRAEKPPAPASPGFARLDLIALASWGGLSVAVGMLAIAWLLGGCGLLRDLTPDQRAALAAFSQEAAAANLDALSDEIAVKAPQGAAAVRACAPLVDEAIAESIMGDPCAVELARRAVACASGALHGFGLEAWAWRVERWGRVLVADVALVAVTVGRADLALCGVED